MMSEIDSSKWYRMNYNNDVHWYLIQFVYLCLLKLFDRDEQRVSPINLIHPSTYH
jgi:hypothetical protein